MKHFVQNFEEYYKQWFQVLTAASMKFGVFWDIAPCSLEVNRYFRGVYCLHQQGNDGGSTRLWNVGQLQCDHGVTSKKTLNFYVNRFITNISLSVLMCWQQMWYCYTRCKILDMTALNNISSYQHHTSLRKYIPVLFVTLFTYYI
jgi:hypothetical protein